MRPCVSQETANPQTKGKGGMSMPYIQILFIFSVIAFVASAVMLLVGLIPAGCAGIPFIGKAAGLCRHARKYALIGLIVSLMLFLIAYLRAEEKPGLLSPSMTTIGTFSEEIMVLQDKTPTALVYTESIGAPDTFTVTVDDPAIIREALNTILHEWAAKQEERMKAQSMWYGEDAVLKTRFEDNGDEARSVTVLTLSAGGKTLTGHIEGAYDVLSVEKQPDGYVISYTYGDFYSHDAIRSSRVTVENGKLVITDLAQ